MVILNLVRDGVMQAPYDLGPYESPRPPFPGNALSYWKGPAISFLHFEKCAGTSLIGALTNLAHPLQIDDDPQRGLAPHLQSAFAVDASDELRRKAIVWGHYDLPALRRLCPTRLVITMMRDPKKRILSLYHYCRSLDPALVRSGVGFNVAAACELDLLDFLKCPDPLIRNYIDNVYARRLTGEYLIPGQQDRLQDDREGVLHGALGALGTLAFAGVVERMDRCLPVLADVIGAATRLQVSRMNASDDNATNGLPIFRLVPRQLVNEAVDAELERLTSLDAFIYKAVFETFD